MADTLSPALKAVSDAVLGVAAHLSVDEVLQGLVNAARELVHARYAALGIPDGAGGFRRFLVAGMSDELIASMGPLPRTHGMLAAMLHQTQPYRTDDIRDDPRFRGWWPAGHPDMRSFLGVPILAPGNAIIGAFYLTEKEGLEGQTSTEKEGPEGQTSAEKKGPEGQTSTEKKGPGGHTSTATFDAEDQEVIELLAAHASIAITNARLYEQSRELSIVSERNRLALELHDVVSQKLFSVMLTAEAAATQIDRDTQAARAQLDRVRELTKEALDELRSLILGLRPPELERDGLEGALRKEVELLSRVHGTEIELQVAHAVQRNGGEREFAVLRIAHEAIQNALRHARAEHVTVRVAGKNDHLVVEVSDDGVGFEPERAELRSRHLGLTSMEERARELRGHLEIHSAPGRGTTVRLELANDA